MGLLSAFAPDEVARSVCDIDLDALAGRGIEGLLLDVDNTLIGRGSVEPDADRCAWLEGAIERFHVCLLSNSVRGTRVRRLKERFGIDGIAVWHWDRKPCTGGVRRALALTGTAPEHTAMIGDQLLTDIWGGNRAGLYTVWVERISPREFIYTRHVHRRIEAFIARRLQRAGLLPGPARAVGEACEEQ